VPRLILNFDWGFVGQHVGVKDWYETGQYRSDPVCRYCFGGDGQKQPKSLPFVYRFLTDFVLGEVGTWW
jgi:hypothetical protein